MINDIVRSFNGRDYVAALKHCNQALARRQNGQIVMDLERNIALVVGIAALYLSGRQDRARTWVYQTMQELQEIVDLGGGESSWLTHMAYIEVCLLEVLMTTEAGSPARVARQHQVSTVFQYYTEDSPGAICAFGVADLMRGPIESLVVKV